MFAKPLRRSSPVLVGNCFTQFPTVDKCDHHCSASVNRSNAFAWTALVAPLKSSLVKWDILSVSSSQFITFSPGQTVREHNRQLLYHHHHNYHRLFISILILCAVLLASSTFIIPAKAYGSPGTYSHPHYGPRPPRIKEHPTSVVVKKHEPVTLSCKADGDPTPVIEWFKDNELVRELPNRIFLSNGDLFILNVMNHKKEKDTGVYYCLARNEHGKARSHNATIEMASIRDDFRVLPKNVWSAVGDRVVLECSPPRGFPEPVVQWKKEGELVPLDNRFRLSDSNLVVSDVQPEDAGRYQCTAQNMGGLRESPPAQLIVRVKPFFIRRPEDVTVFSNEVAEIDCKIGGDPLPKVTWRREGGKMPTGRTFITDDKSIRISHVTEEDEGIYICEAENLVGKISSSSALIVHTKPNFLVKPKDVRINLNGAVQFDCVASGNPRPSIFWTKEGNQILMFPDNKYGRFTVTFEGSLIISPVKKEDIGFYVCSALSVVGSSTTKAHLNISSAVDIPPPIIILGPADQTLPEHTTAMLPCEATGTPEPALKWMLNNSSIPLNNRRFQVLDSGSLKIDDLQLSDSGEYKCVVFSENGESSWSSMLKVAIPHSTNTMFHQMPDPSTYPDAPSRPTILNQTENSITISWRRVGRDGASPFMGYIVEYYSPDHHNEWIRAAKSVTVDVFTVKGLKSGSRYFFLIRAQNSHGIGSPSPISSEARTLSATSSISTLNNVVNSIEARNKLDNFIVVLKDVRAISSSVVKLFWDVKGGQEFVEGFYVRYRAINQDNSSNSNLLEHKYEMVTVYNGGASTYILNNLPKYTTFEFFLVPFYKTIDGKPSNTRIVTTLEDIPSAAPTLIKAQPVSSSSALVTWQSPPVEHINGLLLGYNLYVHGTYIPYNVNLSVNAETTSFMLRNLTSETEYVIQILAYTSVGPGPFSSSLTFIMDPLLSMDVFSERNSSVLDSANMSNIWIGVLIVSLIILSLIVLLLGFLLLKKRNSILKKNKENLSINPELNSRLYSRQWQYNWKADSANHDFKTSGLNSTLKISSSFHHGDNNGYSTVTTDEQAADYAEVSQTGDGYESAYYASANPIAQDAPVAYASSSIISTNQFNGPNKTIHWPTQINCKPNLSTTDRNYKKNSYIIDNIRFNKPADSYDFNKTHGKKSHGLSIYKQAKPLINGPSNDYEDTSLYYADSLVYGSNVTQIPSSQLMANQLKYGSLSRISNRQVPFDAMKDIKTSLILNDNYNKKAPTEWETKQNQIPSSLALFNQSQASLSKNTRIQSKNFCQTEIDSGYKSTGVNRHIIANPLLDRTPPINYRSPSFNENLAESNGHNIRANFYTLKENSLTKMRNDSANNNNTPINCDNESTYQELL